MSGKPVSVGVLPLSIDMDVLAPDAWEKIAERWESEPPHPGDDLLFTIKGGEGSGHWGHRGRPGQRGGSLPGVQGVTEDFTDKDSFLNYARAARIEETYEGPQHERYFQALGYIAEYEHGTVAIDTVLNGGRYIPKNKKLDSWNGSGKAYTALSDSARASLKKRIVEKLYNDLNGEVPREEIARFVSAWARSSNGYRLESLSIQEAIAEEFGVQLSDWQVKQMEIARKYTGPAIEEFRRVSEGVDFVKMGSADAYEWRKLERDAALVKFSDAPPDLISAVFLGGLEKDPGYTTEFDRGTARKIARAIFNNTQEKLNAAYNRELTTREPMVTLYRGIENLFKGVRPGQIVRYLGNSAESWTADIHTATSFGRTVLAIRVPLSRIYSTARTGVGCIIEGEVVVMGLNDILAGVAYVR